MGKYSYIWADSIAKKLLEKYPRGYKKVQEELLISPKMLAWMLVNDASSWEQTKTIIKKSEELSLLLEKVPEPFRLYETFDEYFWESVKNSIIKYPNSDLTSRLEQFILKKDELRAVRRTGGSAPGLRL